jgi:hypothetical protein
LSGFPGFELIVDFLGLGVAPHPRPFSSALRARRRESCEFGSRDATMRDVNDIVVNWNY